ncbi:hypothetical protein C1H46_031444 [Malus baccata]|uniref:Uncharacterized protein n=1 Tax=Malus baccata TaxID=106549 RepID=A0A540L990_MALBA|nr:hypothetical protein C1H46_031444 [Malus baccata]
MCSETSPPRLSFSHDLGQPDVLPVGRRDTSLLDMNCDFEFSFRRSSFECQSSSADELFLHGVILPMQPKEKVSNSEVKSYSSPAPLPSHLPIHDDHNPKKESKNSKEDIDSSSDHFEQKPQSKSFWGFKRSSSLNQENKKSLFCSLQLLSRSNSTGSAPNPKKAIFKDVHKQKQTSNISMLKSASCSSSFSSSSSLNPHASLVPRPRSRKGYNGSSYYGNVVRVSPVLNVPSPYISKGTANLFCLGSFLHPGKDKKGKK